MASRCGVDWNERRGTNSNEERGRTRLPDEGRGSFSRITSTRDEEELPHADEGRGTRRRLRRPSSTWDVRRGRTRCSNEERGSLSRITSNEGRGKNRGRENRATIDKRRGTRDWQCAVPRPSSQCHSLTGAAYAGYRLLLVIPRMNAISVASYGVPSVRKMSWNHTGGSAVYS